MDPKTLEYIKQSIKSVADYPKPGIVFRDVTSLLEDPKAFHAVIQTWIEAFKDHGFTKVVGTESRGFIFGTPLAYELGLGFVPVRKPGKLPRETISQDYELEYGVDTIEIHTDAIVPGDKVLLIDDLIATGGTAEASIKLIRKLGGEVNHAAFVINLVDLPGYQRIVDMGVEINALVEFEGE
ncbi:adenine phosphoribosyltransferase [Alginatibacterium sediminis]|uniref:Adenine phosphoribosyltransferase n=1 Tax=Alginatibacterium sediminis TaxID=2164068 RepID=A0A420EHT1_9ALTE|nr:adenine phosphoribosyltransferase [Alginatibacterium sediminis]RKF20255.1 adenine phosphoribosyltransferase [Alginatibacterium sediminis]